MGDFALVNGKDVPQTIRWDRLNSPSCGGWCKTRGDYNRSLNLATDLKYIRNDASYKSTTYIIKRKGFWNWTCIYLRPRKKNKAEGFDGHVVQVLRRICARYQKSVGVT